MAEMLDDKLISIQAAVMDRTIIWGHFNFLLHNLALIHFWLSKFLSFVVQNSTCNNDSACSHWANPKPNCQTGEAPFHLAKHLLDDDPGSFEA